MLAELRIADLGVISDATIEPGPGFTVVTGETGAGKTMIVTGLALLGGVKADPRLVRVGAARALVEGRWRVDDPTVAAAVADLGGEVEDGEVLLTRQLGGTRSRFTVGGAQVPLAVGGVLVSEWITIHGQSEQVRLGTPERQREVLDRFAGPELDEQLAGYRRDFETRRAVVSERDDLIAQARARARELDQLRFALDEIGRVAPSPGEDRDLAAEATRLQAVDDLRTAARTAAVALAGDDERFGEVADALALVATARKALAQVVHADPDLAPPVAQLSDAAALLADTASNLASYVAGLDADPVRLEWIAGRRSQLQHLTRKYGATVEEVLAYADQAARRVAELDSTDDRIAALSAQSEALEARLADVASRLTRLRKQAAARLADQVAAELRALAMPRARLEFAVTPLESLGPHGADQVVLLFSANPGAQPGPLGRVASGGELSRVRLALEVVLAGEAGGRTFVFDEVDAGVGGAVALEIGRRLARLARNTQVIVVTHLAQVAAFADRHYVVAKADDGRVTTSSVHLVQADERLAALARMMGGLEDSESALDHAADLLGAAGQAVRGASG